MKRGRRIAHCNSPVGFLADCVQLPLFELGDPDRAPAFDGANERGADERQGGALAKARGMNAPARQAIGAANARVLEGHPSGTRPWPRRSPRGRVR